MFVIVNKRISIKKDNYEIIALEEKDIEKAMKISPLLISSALAEAKPIINSKLVERLKKRYIQSIYYGIRNNAKGTTDKKSYSNWKWGPYICS